MLLRVWEIVAGVHSAYRWGTRARGITREPIGLAFVLNISAKQQHRRRCLSRGATLVSIGPDGVKEKKQIFIHTAKFSVTLNRLIRLSMLHKIHSR